MTLLLSLALVAQMHTFVGGYSLQLGDSRPAEVEVLVAGEQARQVRPGAGAEADQIRPDARSERGPCPLAGGLSSVLALLFARLASQPRRRLESLVAAC